jgi:hypothetical protein
LKKPSGILPGTPISGLSCALGLSVASMGGEMQTESDQFNQLNLAVLAAIAIYAITAILQLSWGDMGFLSATAFAAGIYFFVYRNLRTNLATAKIGTMVAAIGAGIFWLLNMSTGQFFFAPINGIGLACMVFAFQQLRKLEHQA